VFFVGVVNSHSQMFCPKCKAEYRPGFSHCSDCDVDLVKELPESDHTLEGGLTETNLRNLESVWSGEDQAECVFICEQFKAAGVPFKVTQRSHQFLKGVDEHYEIGVPPEFCNQARKKIAEGRSDFTDEPEDQKIMELPAKNGPSSIELQRKDWKPSRHPESATVEVFCENTDDRAWMIEASLRENYIDSRIEVLDDGSRRIFVKPDDEPQAREIVREIKEGSPPT